MSTKQTPRYVRGRQPAAIDFEGAAIVINESTILQTDDPIVRKHPDLFVPLEAKRQRPGVEAMTAAPGEKRGQA
jgi:hypothetical protein